MIHNIFEGINPVLNEKFLYDMDWQDFHNSYLVHLRDALKRDLYPKGYSVGLEQTIQIQYMADESKSYRPDIIISQKKSSPAPSTSPMPATANQVLTYEEVFDEADLDTVAIAIRKRDDATPVTWIELLSPTNKPPFSHFPSYQSKRSNVYNSGVCFIELDFIHTQPPTLPQIADYTAGITNAYPFHIAVFTPRPSPQKGKIFLYHFGVADKIPTTPIPLEGDETHLFDFNAPYQKMFDESLYGLELDYALDSYHHYQPQDREYIQQRIATMP